MHTPIDGSSDASLQTPPSCSASTPQLPKPPSPSADPGITASTVSPCEDPEDLVDPDGIDIFTMSAVVALKLLCGTVETLVRITGDIPPTPPIDQPRTPNLGLIKKQREKSNSFQISASEVGIEGHEDVPPKAKTPIGSPEARPSEPLHIDDSSVESLSIQHGAIARKFYSKKPPPIPLEEYLMRLHKYCPMSTAVYLATSLYIHRLAVIERTIPVTARNVHRLVLAGLRVAMKALEDLSYPHGRFAKVGGVSEPELGRLEISFCFVTNFELKVDKEMLLAHAKTASDGTRLYKAPINFQPKLPPLKDKRRLVISQSKPLAVMKSEAPAAA